MKSFVIAALALAAVNLSSAQDDGRYRPEIYGGDDGSYRHQGDGQYSESQYGGGRYQAVAASFNQPTYVRQPVNAFQVAPASFGNGILDPYSAFASASANSANAIVQPSRVPTYASRSSDANARILRQDQDVDLYAYHYLYQTENGINAEETGRIDPSPNVNSGTKATGYYEYVGDDGVKYRVDYVADENGFQPQGAHLPKASK